MMSPKGLRMPSLQVRPTMVRTPSHLLPEDIRLDQEEDGVLITELQHEGVEGEEAEQHAGFSEHPQETEEEEEERPEGAEYDTDLEDEGKAEEVGSVSGQRVRSSQRLNQVFQIWTICLSTYWISAQTLTVSKQITVFLPACIFTRSVCFQRKETHYGILPSMISVLHFKIT